jgi:hypothetical protein
MQLSQMRVVRDSTDKAWSWLITELEVCVRNEPKTNRYECNES